MTNILTCSLTKVMLLDGVLLITKALMRMFMPHCIIVFLLYINDVEMSPNQLTSHKDMYTLFSYKMKY